MSISHNYFIDQINKNTNETLSFVASLSQQQIDYIPQTGWRILEILEHILLTEKLVFLLLKRPSNEKSNNTFIVGENTLKEKIVELRANKLKAPDPLQPKGKFQTATDFINEFAGFRTQLISEIESKSILVDDRIFKHPYLGEMSVPDWLVFITYHNQRHLLQAKELLQNNH